MEFLICWCHVRNIEVGRIKPNKFIHTFNHITRHKTLNLWANARVMGVRV